jgi:hypothetical protein
LNEFGVSVSHIIPAQRSVPVLIPATHGRLPVPEVAPIASTARRWPRYRAVPLRTDAATTYLAQHIAQEVLPPAGPDPGCVRAYLGHTPPAFEGLNYRAVA